MTRFSLQNGPAPVLALVVAAAVVGAVHGGFSDLDVYLYRGQLLLDDLPI